MINPSKDVRHVFVTIGPLHEQAPATSSSSCLNDSKRSLLDPYRRLASQLESTAFKPTWSGMLYDPMLTDISSDFSDQQDRLEGLCAAYVRPENTPRNANPFWQVLAQENPSWGLGTTRANHQSQPMAPFPIIASPPLHESDTRQSDDPLTNTQTPSASSKGSKRRGKKSSGQSQITSGFAVTGSTTTTTTFTASLIPKPVQSSTSLSDDDDDDDDEDSPTESVQSTTFLSQDDEYATLATVRASFLKEPFLSLLSDTAKCFASLPANSQDVRPFGRAKKRRSSCVPVQDHDSDRDDEDDDEDDEEGEAGEIDPNYSPPKQGRRKRTRISSQGHHTVEGSARGLDYQSMMYNMATMSMVDLHQEYASMSPTLTSSSGSDGSTLADPSSLGTLPSCTQLKPPRADKTRYSRSPAPSPSSRSETSQPSDSASVVPPQPPLQTSIARPNRSTRVSSSPSPSFFPAGVKKSRLRDTRYLQFKRAIAVKTGQFIFECNACPPGHFQFHDDRQLKRHAVSHLFSKSRNKFRCLGCPDGQNFARRDAVRRHFESVTYKCCFDRGFYEELDSDRDQYLRRRIESHWTKSSR